MSPDSSVWHLHTKVNIPDMLMLNYLIVRVSNGHCPAKVNISQQLGPVHGSEPSIQHVAGASTGDAFQLRSELLPWSRKACICLQNASNPI